MEQIYYFSLDQTNFYHSKCRISQKLWCVEIKKTPLLNTSSDIQSLCITKNPFFFVFQPQDWIALRRVYVV